MKATAFVAHRGRRWCLRAMPALLFLAAPLLITHWQAAATISPVLPTIESTSHPDEYSWYANDAVSFKWDSLYLTEEGSCAVRNLGLEVAVSGNYAYVANGWGLSIVNISNPQAPAVTSEYDTLGYATDVAVSGNYAYVGDNHNGLEVVDISNPAAPVSAGTFSGGPFNTESIVIAGHYAYLASSYDGLEIVDISNPASPAIASKIDDAQYEGIAVSGNYAYLVGWFEDLRVLDISDPAHPVNAGSYRPQGSESKFISVSGNHAYLMDFTGGLEVLDVSNPATITHTGSYPKYDYYYGMDVSGTDVFLTSTNAGVEVIDVSDPSAPAFKGKLNPVHSGHGIALSGNFAYVSSYEGSFAVVSKHDYAGYSYMFDQEPSTVPDPVSDGTTASFHLELLPVLGDGVWYFHVRSQDAAGNWGPAGSRTVKIDTSGPTVSQIVSSTHPDENQWYSNHDPSFTWEAFDDKNLAMKGSIPGFYANTVSVSGTRAYLSGGDVKAVDVSDPANPVILGTYQMSNSDYLVTSGNFAYVISGSAEFSVIDFSDPAHPALRGLLNIFPNLVFGMAVSGNDVYLACASGGLKVIDVSNPAAPTVKHSYPIEAFGVAISGNHAYVADVTSGMGVVDISDPAAPIGVCDTPGNAVGIAASGNYAYVADQDAGVSVIDVSDPTAPVLRGTVDTPGHAENVAVSGTNVYVADGFMGVEAVDITNPDNPKINASTRAPGAAMDVAASGNTVYVGAYESGFSVLNYGSPAGYSYLLDQNSATGPDTVSEGSTAAASFSGVGNGVWFFHVRAQDVVGNWGPTSTRKIQIGSPRNYWWSWYDNVYMHDWVIMANPSGSGKSIDFGLQIGGADKDLSPFSVSGQPAGRVPEGRSVAATLDRLMDGPVNAFTIFGDKAVVSQRSLMGDSLEEVLGTDAAKLSDHYFWPWYDQVSPGFRNWILVSNPGTDKVRAEISVHGKMLRNTLSPGAPDYGRNYFEIEPGQSITPEFPGITGGPVEVKVYRSGGDWNNPADKRNVIASQRVVSGGGTAFNEVPGIPASDLANSYQWTWYDSQSPGYRDWILLANPDYSVITYQVKVAGQLLPCHGTGPASHDKTSTTCVVGPLGTEAIEYPGLMNGPVEVTTSNGNLIASQRSKAGPSFEEVPGYPTSGLASDYHWTWYDEQSPGARDWVAITNPGSESVNYLIRIAGSIMPTSATNPGTIPAGGRVTPEFPGVMNGPVEVIASDKVMVSQRVTWNGYFNEVLGTVLD